MSRRRPIVKLGNCPVRTSSAIDVLPIPMSCAACWIEWARGWVGRVVRRAIVSVPLRITSRVLDRLQQVEPFDSQAAAWRCGPCFPAVQRGHVDTEGVRDFSHCQLCGLPAGSTLAVNEVTCPAEALQMF